MKQSSKRSTIRKELCCFVCVAGLAAWARSAEPRLVTAETRGNKDALALLQKPGRVFFEDDFETEASLKNYFEIRGLTAGNVTLVKTPEHVHSGSGALQCTAVDRNGKSSGAGASAWFGPKGYDHVHLRLYIKFAEDYNQGNLNHTGGGLAAVSGTGKWDEMGKAGIRPNGDDRFNSRFEPWCDWQRITPPGYLFLYTYWMEMKRDPDGHYWGNMLGPKEKERFVPERGRWYCLEHMIKANRPGTADGELAAWIDGKLYIHYKNIRWRSAPRVKLKRFGIGVYIHSAKKDNTVWYDDIALSTGYIGPKK